ncbi:MAG: hypothetical protein AB1606_00630 [Nitrospirota bacterium]
MYESLVGGVACILVPLFTKYSGYEIPRKPFEWIGISGVFFVLGFLLALRFEVGWLDAITCVCSIISYIIGWVGLIIGSIWGAICVVFGIKSQAKS